MPIHVVQWEFSDPVIQGCSDNGIASQFPAGFLIRPNVIEPCYCLSFPSLLIDYSWLAAGAGGYVGEAEHFPAFRQGSGGSAGVRACPIVHISTGASVWT